MKKMDKTFRKTALTAAALLLMGGTAMSMSSCGETGSVARGDIEYSQADLQAKPFSKIDIDVLADVTYTQNDGRDCHVRLDYSAIADPEVAEQLKKVVRVVYRDGGVTIGLKGKVNGVARMKEGRRLKIFITSPDIVKMTLEGVGTLRADSINTDRLDIDNEGVGSVSVKRLLANVCKIDNEGVGSVSVSDMLADRLDIDNEGVGSVTIGQCKVGRMKIDNEGVGKVTAKVDCQDIQASLDGVGSINLTGVTNTLSVSKDGVGSINTGNLEVRQQAAAPGPNRRRR